MGLFNTTKILAVLCLWIQCCFTFAEAPLLPVAQAFQFSTDALDQKQAELSWKIAPNYYLYQHKFSVKENGHDIQVKFPQAVSQHDENFGTTLVYFDQVKFKINTQANKTYDITWQGCAKERLCYPPQHIQVQTDVDGLIAMQDQVQNKTSLLELSQQNNAPQQPIAQDQKFADQLTSYSFAYSVLLFLGLGMLLAFTPCSLPMLPILSSLIIREHKGVKAWSIAFVFVCSMAVVYAVLGMIAASAGLGFQRWLQQPATLVAFSGLFVLFALNLFGLFEIRLPQKWTQHLDKMQSNQKGGSLIGAAVMGIISALLVGPCMTAPLAGALLYITQQTQDQWQGAVFLFSLGFGMGIPLLMISLLGAKFLPKAGHWMTHIKVIFAFIMLGLALYFSRSLLSTTLFYSLSAVLCAVTSAYLIYGIFRYTKALKILYLGLLIGVIAGSFYQYQQYRLTQIHTDQTWHIARTAAEFNTLLAQAPQGQPIVIDVYADWCTACQPIEHHVLTQPDIQTALAPFYLIKLDLTQYDTSHQAILTQWDILGPPTYLFLDHQHQEQRNLRLTGEFNATTLKQQLQSAR